MGTYMIGYDLHDGEDYADLEAAIEEIDSAYWHCLDSTWLINTALKAVDIRDRLKPHLRGPNRQGGDVLLVAKLHGSWACTGSFSPTCKDWLKSNVTSG